jgi:hypothetical protein
MHTLTKVEHNSQVDSGMRCMLCFVLGGDAQRQNCNRRQCDAEKIKKAQVWIGFLHNDNACATMDWNHK